MIGNCTISALINGRGRVVWCCMPRFDGDPVFHALLGTHTGNPEDGQCFVDLEGFVRSRAGLQALGALRRG